MSAPNKQLGQKRPSLFQDFSGRKALKKVATPSSKSGKSTAQKSDVIDLDDEDNGKKIQVAIGDDDSPEERAQGSLFGVNLAVSGNFKTITRQKIEDFISKNKGKLQNSVTKTTHYLVLGHILEDGRQPEEGFKFKRAMGFGIPILRETEFEEFCRKRLRNPSFQLGRQAQEQVLGETNLGGPPKESEVEKIESIEDIFGKNPPKISRVEKPSTPVLDQGLSTMALENRVLDEIPPSMMLWVDKYKPKRREDLVGNLKAIEKFSCWLRDWHDVIIRGRKKPMPLPSKGQGWSAQSNVNARACMISGPPGIGKSSMVKIITEQLGFQVKEINASDKRSKVVIEEILSDLSGASSMKLFLKHPDEERNAHFRAKRQKLSELQKTVIVMDEADGVSASDRGGIAALIRMIKKSRSPIVCISNDHSSRKIKSLIDHCYDIRFHKPEYEDIIERIGMIAQIEKLRIEQTALEQIMDFSGKDLRQIINILQLWKTTSSDVNKQGIKLRKSEIQKDQKTMINPFQATQIMLSREGGQMSFNEKLNLYFVDFGLIPLLVQENYLSCFSKEDRYGIEKAADCAELLSQADVLSNEIFQNRQWGLLRDLGSIGVVVPSDICRGFCPYTKFPEVMPKMSTMRKSARLIRELKEKGGPILYASRMSIQNEYVPLIYDVILESLYDSKYSENKDSINDAAQLLLDLNLSIDQFKENLMGLLLDEKRQADFNDEVDPQTKSAFTRAYNNLNLSSIKAKKTKGAGGGGGGGGAPGIPNIFGSTFDPDIQDIASDQELSESDHGDESDTEIVEAKQGKGRGKRAAPKKDAAAKGTGRGKKGKKDKEEEKSPKKKREKKEKKKTEKKK